MYIFFTIFRFKLRLLFFVLLHYVVDRSYQYAYVCQRASIVTSYLLLQACSTSWKILRFSLCLEYLKYIRFVGDSASWHLYIDACDTKHINGALSIVWQFTLETGLRQRLAPNLLRQKQINKMWYQNTMDTLQSSINQ